ncbi:hypothetical protein BDZ45DRAFT_785836, partial [Acephala macrosclerotiorum]
IAVVGITGSGKSSSIKRLTEDSTIRVGDSLTSETEEIATYTFTHNLTKYALIDTPGFDDTKRDDYDIFPSLTSYLASSYRSGRKLNGIPYLHHIIDQKMQGSALRNLTMFRKLCGEDCLRISFSELRAGVY